MKKMVGMVFIIWICVMCGLTSKVYGKTIVGNKEYSFEMKKGETISLDYISKGDSCFCLGTYKQRYGKLTKEIIVDYKLYCTQRTNTKGKYAYTNWFGFKEGKKISIELNNQDNDTVVKVKVKEIKKRNFEKEDNDSKNKSTELTSGSVYNGLVHRYDFDWWVFTAPEDGKYLITGVATNSNRNNYVKMTVYDGNIKLSNCYCGVKEGWKKLYKGSAKKGEKIFIMAKGLHDGFYRIKVKKIR